MDQFRKWKWYYLGWLIYYLLDVLVNSFHYSDERLSDVFLDSALSVTLAFLVTHVALYYFFKRYPFNKSKVELVLVIMGCLMLLYASRYAIANRTFGFSDYPWLPVGKIIKNFVRDASLTALAVSLAIIYDWKVNKQKLIELEKDQLRLQYQVLVQQLQPHFLFNTLNNIYALIQKKPNQGGEALLGLSRVLEYTVYRDAFDLVPIQDELEVIDSYVDLMRLKYRESLEYSIEVPSRVLRLPALSLLSLVENAFKHGQPINGKMTLNIAYEDTTEGGILTVRNSSRCEGNWDRRGKGLLFLSQQLKNYPELYDDFRIICEEKQFSLSIPIKKEAL